MEPSLALPIRSVPHAAAPTFAGHWISVALGLLLAAPAAGAAQCPLGSTGADAASMALRLKVGDSRRMVTTVDQLEKHTTMGQEQTMHQVTRTGIRYDVLAPDASGRPRVRFTYESMSLDANSPFGTFSWSSSDTPGTVPPLARVFAALLGREYIAVMDPDGSNPHVEGSDSVATRLLDGMTVGFRENTIERAMKEAIAIMPPQSAAVGASWSCTSHTGGGHLRMIEKSTRTVDSRTGGVTKVKITAKMASDSAASPSTFVRYALEGTRTSTMEIEEATGWIIRSQSESAVSGSVIMDSPAGPMDNPMSVKTRTTIESAGGS